VYGIDRRARPSSASEIVGALDAATKTLVPDPKDVVTVRRIFTAYADEHLGATGLANHHLSGAGSHARGERLWTNQTVLCVLRNPVYGEKISDSDEIDDREHPSIVDDDLLDRAEAQLDEQAALVDNRAPNPSEYLLTGVLRCRACGGAPFGAGTTGTYGLYRNEARRDRQAEGT
jgi:site-specific DNA recombinase